MKTLFYLVIIFILISCNNRQEDNNTKNQNISLDTISYYLNNKNLNISEYNLDNYLKIIKTNNNSILARNNIAQISSIFYYQNNLNKFKKSSRLLLKLSLQANDSINLAKSFRYLAGYYKDSKIYDSSYYYYLKSEKIYKYSKDFENYAVILLYKSIVQYNISDYLAADISARNSYLILKDKSNFEKTFSVLNNLGLISTELKEYDIAIDYHIKALKIVKEKKLEFLYNQESLCYNNIGYLYLKKGDYYSAIENFNLGLKDTNIKKIDPDLHSLLIDNLSYSKFKLKDYKNVPQLFQNALKIRDSLNDIRGIINSNIHLSEYYDAIKDTTSSLKYSREALQLSKESQNPFDVVISLKQAAAVDKKNASAYTKDYIRISDSLQDMERKNIDRFTRIQLETDELIKENVFLVEKNREILNYFLMSVIIFGSLFYMRSQRAKTRYLILKQAQQRTNEDIYRLIISQQDKLDEGKAMEKVRISKELHDGILGRLFGLRLNLDGLNQRSDENAEQERINCLNALQLIEQDLREISHELSREKTVLINNFISIVEKLFEEQMKVNKAKLITLIDDKINWDLLSNTTKINLFRIIQECLQNTNKYAKAKNITIAFKKDTKGNLILTIFDDGIGFEVNSKNKGIGLTNIIERTHESLGTIEINSSKNKGTAVKIIVPLESKTIKI